MTDLLKLDSVISPESVVRRQLENGLTVLVRRDTTAPVVSIVTWVGAGYFDETDDQVGIAHALEHMYFKGTHTRGVSEIARATKAVGGSLNAGTIYDHTHYYVTLPASGFEAGLEVQADAYANSVVDADELRRELEVIIEETRRKADTASALSLETLFELLHDRHRIRRWRMGREHELRAMTRDQLVAFYRNFYRPSNTVLAIAGDVEPEHAFELAQRYYGHLADGEVKRVPGPRETDAPGFRIREWEGDITQTELLFGWRTPGNDHADTPALDLLATVLSGGRASRLVRATRDRRLVSSISSYNYVPTDIGIFVIHAGARPERVAEAAQTIWDQLERVRAGEITSDELERARSLVEAQWLRRLESTDGQANFLGAWELTTGDWRSGARYYEALLDTGLDRLREVAARWLAKDAVSMIVYRPRGSAPLAAEEGDADSVLALLESASPPALDPSEPVTSVSHARGKKAVKEREVDGIHVYRTSDGVPILIRQRPGSGLAHLGCFIHGGVSTEESSNGGITTLMARSALRGTSRRSATQIAEDAERLGGVPSATVGTESFNWSITVPTRSFDGASELISEIVVDPRFPNDGIEAERAVAIAALTSLKDDMYRQPMRLAAEVAWPDHPYGRSTLGTEESVNTFNAESLRAWHRVNVLRSHAVLAAVVDLDPDEAAEVLALRFAELRHSDAVRLPRVEWTNEVCVRVDQREKAQTALSLLFEGPARNDTERFDAELIGSVASGLGGRFFEELRDKQSLAYVVLARPFARNSGGAFAAYIATSPAKEDVARAGLLREFDRLAKNDISDAELNRARTFTLGSWMIRQSAGGAVLGDLADAWLHGTLEELSRYPSDLAAVTTQRMREVAERWFNPARRVEGIVRGQAETPARR